MTEVAWLIEDQFSGHARWWHGSGYSEDSHDAVRFSRKADAERVIRTVLAKEDFPLIATDHLWIDEVSE